MMKQKEKILSTIKEAIPKIREFYGKNLHSIWVTGSVAKDYPYLEGDYWDIDLLVFTFTRKAKQLKVLETRIPVDIGTMWFATKYFFKRGLKKNYTRYAFQQIQKNSKCIWDWKKGWF